MSQLGHSNLVDYIMKENTVLYSVKKTLLKPSKCSFVLFINWFSCDLVSDGAKKVRLTG